MDNQLHIGYIVSHYPHQAFGHDGGLGTSVYNLVERIRRKNVKVSVFVYGQNEDFVIQEENLTIYSIKMLKKGFFKFYFYRKSLAEFINKKVASEKINLIEAPDWTGITAFMHFKVPLVIRFHGSDAYFCHLEQRKQKFKNFLFEKMAIRNATTFIAPTNFAGELSAKLFKITKKVTTIHYGLDLQKFHNPTPEIYEKGLIVYVGTVIRKKGVMELPAIFKLVLNEFPEAKLVIIGGDSPDIKTQSDSTWNLMKKQFSESDLQRVNYLGKIPYQQVQDYIKQANVCVFPTFAETLGMVTIESMALQKPVVNSNIGWANELIVDGESGFLVHPENHNLFANTIVQLLSDEDLAIKIGQNAYERTCQKFDIDKIAEQNIAFYKSTINQN